MCRIDNNLPRPCPVELITPSHPRMVLCSGSDVSGASILPGEGPTSWENEHSEAPEKPLVL